MMNQMFDLILMLFDIDSYFALWPAWCTQKVGFCWSGY
ncbi:hypothetical protein SynA1562_00153 [Synechococcus sp. A15-62]|nr:hypothetical protein SynA1562_00153 [Synechococcus sp. A15-62]